MVASMERVRAGVRLLAVCVAAVCAQPVMAATVAVGKFHRAAAVAALLDTSQATTRVELLARPQQTRDLRAGLSRIGASVWYADERSGYVFAVVPREQLLATLSLPSVETAAIADGRERDGFIPLEGRRATGVPEITLPMAHPATNPLPAAGLYFPAEEVGLAALWKAHPTADGRGTRIALCDDGMDLLHPALRSVRAANGVLAPKTIDFVTDTRPEDDNNWVVFGPDFTAVNHTLIAEGTTWKVPANETYRLGIFARSLQLSYRTHPDAITLSLSVGVLWSPGTGVVRVDTDGDADFTNNRALRDYAVAQEVDWFGAVRGDADNRIPFGVKLDTSRGAAWLSFSRYHGPLVAGTMTANRLTGGLFDGAAPDAQVVDVRSRFDSRIMSMVQAAARGDVDVLNRSGGLGRVSADEKEDFALRVMTRLIAVYDRPIIAYTSAPGAIHIGNYQSPEMLRRNRQLPPPYAEAMNSFVWFTDDGAVNTMVGPSTSLTTLSRYVPMQYVGRDGRQYMSERTRVPPAPEAYAIGSNNSPTISLTSGVVADLVSLAKQRSVQYNAERLTNALFISGRQVAGIPASVQGRGAIDAAAAWTQLESMAKTDDGANRDLTSFETARERDGARTVVHGYSEDFPRANNSATRSLWVTRRGGHSGKRAYRLELRGDTDAFALQRTAMTLRRAEAVRIDFTARAPANTHVAFLRLIDSVTNTVMHEIPLQTRAPEHLGTIAPGVGQYRAEIGPRRTQRRLFALPQGTQAVLTRVEMPYLGDGSYQTFSVSSVDGEARLLGRSGSKRPDAPDIDAANHVGPLERAEATRAAMPGLVQVYWENRGRPEYETPYDPPAPTVPVTATLTMKHYSVAFTNVASDRVAMSNRMAEVRGRIEWLTGRATSEVIATDAARGFGSAEVRVPENATLLQLEVRGPKVRSQSIEVFAVDATGKAPRVRESVMMKDGLATLTVPTPSAGHWQIAVWNRESGGAERYEVRSAALGSRPATEDFVTFGHGAKSELSLPAQSAQGDVVYAAFRIEPAPEEKQGVLIGLTPVAGGAF